MAKKKEKARKFKEFKSRNFLYLYLYLKNGKFETEKMANLKFFQSFRAKNVKNPQKHTATRYQ